MTKPIMTTEVWAQLWLCEDDCLRVRDFLESTGLVNRASIVNRLHLTVYHVCGPMRGVTALNEAADVIMQPRKPVSWSWPPAEKSPSQGCDPATER